MEPEKQEQDSPPALQTTLSTRAAASTAPVTPSSPGMRLLRNLVRSPKSLIGLVIVAIFMLMAIFAPIIAPGDPQEFVAKKNQPPSAQFIFGTEGSGKDVFRQTVWGARLSMLVGFAASFALTFLSTAIGIGR